MNEKWHRHLGAYGICLKEENLLVIRKGAGPYIGRYDLPGGTIEANESLTEAVKREFIEETGICVDIIKNIGVRDYLIPYELSRRGTTHIHHVALYYSVKCVGEGLTSAPDDFEGQDSLGTLWVPLRECNVHNASPLVLEAIQWLKTGNLAVESKRLDDWVVLQKEF